MFVAKVFIFITQCYFVVLLTAVFAYCQSVEIWNVFAVCLCRWISDDCKNHQIYLIFGTGIYALYRISWLIFGMQISNGLWSRERHILSTTHYGLIDEITFKELH